MSKQVRTGIKWVSLVTVALFIGFVAWVQAVGPRGVDAVDEESPTSGGSGAGGVVTMTSTDAGVVFRPEPEAGWTFLRWSGDVSGTAWPLVLAAAPGEVDADFVREDSLMGSLVAGRDTGWAGAERIDVPDVGELVVACDVELVNAEAPGSEACGRATLGFGPESGEVVLLVDHTVAEPVSASIRDVTESGPAEVVVDLGDAQQPISVALTSEQIAALQDAYYVIEVAFAGGAIQGLLDCVDWGALDAKRRAAASAAFPEKGAAEWTEAAIAARRSAMASIRAGDSVRAAADLLAVLRSAPDDDAALLDEVHPLLQLLSFVMAGLLRPADLEAFLGGLDKAAYPLDAAVYVYYYRELDDYWQCRGLAEFSREKMWGLLDELRQSRYVLVEAVGCMQTTAPWPWATVQAEHIQKMFPAFLRLVDLAPSSRLMREPLRENLRQVVGFGCEPDGGIFDLMAVAGEAPEARNSRQVSAMQAVHVFLTGLPWSDAARAVIESEPVVQAVEASQRAGESARTSGAAEDAIRLARVRALAQTAREDPASIVREWSLRTLTTWKSAAEERDMPSGLRDEIDNAHLAVASANASDGSPEKVRARFQWASNAIRAQRLSNRTALRGALELLLTTERTEEPIDINYFEQIPRQMGYLGYALAKEGRYDEAASVFGRLAGLFPNTFLGDKWQSDADLMGRAQAPEQQ